MMPTAPTQELVHSLSASASRKNIIYLLRIDYPATFDRIPSLLTNRNRGTAPIIGEIASANLVGMACK